MRDETTLALRPDLFGQLAATDPFQGRARRLYERGHCCSFCQGQVNLSWCHFLLLLLTPLRVGLTPNWSES